MSVFLSLALAVVVAASPSQTPASTPAPPAEPSQAPPSDPAEVAPLPVSLKRIQRALTQKPRLRPESEKPIFRIEVFGKKPTIEDILGPDYLKGPVSGGAMTHQEFLAMVTPKDVQGYSAFSNGEGFTVAATSLALQWALQKAIHKFSEAKQERDRETARREVLDALAELQQARTKAGLPPK